MLYGGMAPICLLALTNEVQCKITLKKNISYATNNTRSVKENWFYIQCVHA